MAVQQYSTPGALALFAGPLAWFLELTFGYTLASGPCFHIDHRLLTPAAQWTWTHTGLFCLAASCVLIALWSFMVSLAALRRRAAGSRSSFAALWGVAFGGGFFVATLLSGVGLVLLPRCGG